MIATPAIPTPVSPKLWDYAAAELQTELAAGISWLTAAYGKATRQARKDSQGREYHFPAVYSGTGDYLSMFPDGHLGNYCWLDVEDYQHSAYDRREALEVRAAVGLVFWLDLRTAYAADYENRTLEHAKWDVVSALQGMKLTRSALLIDRVAERAENIYKGYGYREIDSLFLMFPYAGFRLEGEMIIKEAC